MHPRPTPYAAGISMHTRCAAWLTGMHATAWHGRRPHTSGAAEQAARAHPSSLAPSPMRRGVVKSKRVPATGATSPVGIESESTGVVCRLQTQTALCWKTRSAWKTRHAHWINPECGHSTLP